MRFQYFARTTRAFLRPTTKDQPMNPIPLPRWARISIALACVGIGLASSTVNGWLLVRGLELTEPDTSARIILIAAGVLMITVELMAFFLAALLPEARLHRLRIMGLALWAFGVVTIFGTRLVLNHSAEAIVAGQAMRVSNLRSAIATRLADAERVRANGQRQNASDNAWTLHLGALAIKQADAMERDIEPLRDELANLRAAQRTTLPQVLGPSLALAHSVAMPVLVSTIGLTMFGVAGMMLRRQTSAAEATPAQRQEDRIAAAPTVPREPVTDEITVPEAPVTPPTTAPDVEKSPPMAPAALSITTLPAQVIGVVPQHRTALPAGTVPAAPPATSPMSAWRAAAASAAVPLSALSVAPVAIAAPTAVTQPQTVAEVQQEPAVTAPVTGMQDDCYQRLRVGVLDGQIKPSVRALREAGGVGTEKARRYLQQLATEGLITKEGQGYALARHPPGRIEDLFV